MVDLRTAAVAEKVPESWSELDFSRSQLNAKDADEALKNAARGVSRAEGVISMTPASRILAHKLTLTVVLPLLFAACSTTQEPQFGGGQKPKGQAKNKGAASAEELKKYILDNIATGCGLQLTSNRATDAYSKFLNKHKVKIKVGDFKSENTRARWDEDTNTLYISRKTLESAAEELHASGVAPAKALEIIAKALLPTLAHEIRHAMIHRELKEKHKIDFPLGSVEAETLATLSEIEVARQLEQSGDIDVSKLPKTLQDVWAGHLAGLAVHDRDGVAGVFKWVKGEYKNYPSITKMTRKELLDFVFTFQASVPARHPKFKETHDRANRCLKVIINKDLYKKLRDYFSQRLKDN